MGKRSHGGLLALVLSIWGMMTDGREIGKSGWLSPKNLRLDVTCPAELAGRQVMI